MIVALLEHRARPAKLLPHRLRLVGHERRKEHGLARELAHQRRQHLIERAERITVARLRKRPRFHGLHVRVPAAHARHRPLQRFVQQKSARPVHRRVVGLDVECIRAVALVARAGRHDPAAILLHHRDHSAREITPRVRKVRVVAFVETLPGETAVTVEGHFAQQEVPEGIRPVAGNRVIQVEPNAGRFAEPLTAVQHEAMSPHALGKWKFRGLEHGRPDDRVEAGDVLADNVQLRRPVRSPRLPRKTGRREIVRQCIEPDVGCLPVARAEKPGKRNSPREPRAAGRDVLESAVDQGQHLVAPAFRLEKLRALGEQRLQESRVLAETKEPVALFDPFQRARWMQHALAVDDLCVLLEGFAPDAVPSFVGFLVEVVRVAVDDALDQRLHPGAMHRVRRADELVVRDIQPPPHCAKGLGKRVDERLWLDALLRGGLLDLLPVLIHADEEMDAVTAQPAISRDGIGTDLFVRVTDVRIAVRIVDGRGDEVPTQ